MGYWGRYVGPKPTMAEVTREVLYQVFGTEFPNSNEYVYHIKKFGVHYIAFRRDNGHVIALVCKYHVSNGYVNVKVMDETCGPYYCKGVTKKFLKYLSPVEIYKEYGDKAVERATAWREGVMDANRYTRRLSRKA